MLLCVAEMTKKGRSDNEIEVVNADETPVTPTP